LTGFANPEGLALLGGLCSLIGKHRGILTYFQTKINKKVGQKSTSFGHPAAA